MTRSYHVDLTEPALADLEQIARWLTSHADADIADRFLAEVLECVGTLEQMPERGSVPTMLEGLDETVRQIPVQSWRLIYEVARDVVSILAVVHERRNLVAAVAERLRH